MGVLLVDFVASLALLAVPMTRGWHFVHTAEWIPSLGIRWHVAIDGISLWLVLLTSFLSSIAILASWKTLGHSPKARLVVTITEVRS